MAFKATKEQKAAINTVGNVLVSAAAGSGKTAVLTERVIKKLTDKISPVSADRLLIVTFTNAAAAEMRSRIERRLDEECRKQPDDIGLMRQRRLLSNAKICTIDSFCIDLVRENFERAGVSPDFKMSDGYSLLPVNELVLSDILKRYYEEENEDFFKLLDTVGAEYDDGDFSDFVLDIYEYSRQLPYPEKWFCKLKDDYINGFTSSNKWYALGVKKALSVSKMQKDMIAKTVDCLTADEKAAGAYLESFRFAADKAEELYNAAKTGDWDKVYAAVNAGFLPNLPRINGLSGSFAAKTAKTAWKYFGKDRESLLKIFYGDTAFINNQMKELSAPVCLLSDILTEFDKRLFEKYLERGTFTFHNTEHLALKLLSGDGAYELSKRYDEVMVDEYQDTNDLQDTLFNILSGGGERLFAVGDVKQSIYGFRGANPDNFLFKKNNAENCENAGENEPKKIILGANFRCKPEVCDYINFFFNNMMTENSGSIVYGDEEKLIPAAIYPKAEGSPAEFDIINCKGTSEERLKAEARHIADYIIKTVNGGAVIREDENTLRKARFSDFTVLLRNTKTKAALIAKTLRENGVPADYSADGYAETREISVFLALLKVIDNPDSDIELLTVLMSPIFGFTAEETAEIRIKRRTGSLYSALVFSAENGGEKEKICLRRIEEYRILSVTLPLNKFISELYYKTDYLNTVSAYKEGERRRNNLLLLLSYAKQYEEDNGGTPGGFIKYVLKQSENGMRSAAVTSGSDSVKIMSIHASKGLQFPVCILADTAAAFNDADARSKTVYSAALGVGFSYFDETEKQKRTTVAREIILDDIRRRSAEEELRLLYVAMTRTQDRLLFTAVFNDAEKTVSELTPALLLAGGRADMLTNRERSYAKWLILTALLHKDGAALRDGAAGIIPTDDLSHIKIKLTEYEEKTENDAPETKDYIEDNTLVTELEKRFAFKYPYAPLLNIEAKSSVSALANKAESDKYAFSGKPSFMSDGGITAAERGTAMHKVIEFIDFDKADDIEGEIERLYEWQYISEREANAVSRKRLKAFFESDTFARIKKAKTVKREMRFLTELPARRVEPTLDKSFDGENIIVQGAVDLCFEEEDGIVVLDFKTDRTENPEDLTKAYGEQLAIYAAACEKIFLKPVKQKLIYSFALSRAIMLA